MDDSLCTAWQKRFGTTPQSGPVELTPFLQHRSVRHYRDESIDESIVELLMGCAQSAATSSNLQLWSAIRIEDRALRDAVADFAGDQHQIRKAPLFLVFLVDHHRLRQAAIRAGQDPAGLDYEEFYTMGVIDAALAAERMVCAAEAIGLGICYIGALRNDPDRAAEFLHLPAGTFACFGLCLGWPDPARPAEIKPRLGQQQVFFTDRYPAESDLGDYDERMSAFYVSEQMKGDVTWSMRSGRRVDGHHMTGREVLKAWLEKQGFSRR